MELRIRPVQCPAPTGSAHRPRDRAAAPRSRGDCRPAHPPASPPAAGRHRGAGRQPPGTPPGSPSATGWWYRLPILWQGPRQRVRKRRSTRRSRMVRTTRRTAPPRRIARATFGLPREPAGRGVGRSRLGDPNPSHPAGRGVPAVPPRTTRTRTGRTLGAIASVDHKQRSFGPKPGLRRRRTAHHQLATGGSAAAGAIRARTPECRIAGRLAGSPSFRCPGIPRGCRR